jgi:hypothetical protein
MNVGNYMHESTAYVRVLFTLKPGALPCGKTTCYSDPTCGLTTWA